MRKAWLVMILLVAIALAMGCTTFKASGLAVLPKGATYQQLGQFHTTVWVNQFLGSPGGTKLFNLSADATDGPVFDAIQREILKAGGSGAINITIINQPDILALILSGVTSGLYAPTRVDITGTVIK